MFLADKMPGCAPGDDVNETKPWREFWQIALEQAADYMETNGHCKGVLRDPYGRVCFRGALIHTMNGALTHQAEAAVAKHLGLPYDYFDNNLTIVRWNNDPERTAYEVISAMRAVANDIQT